MAVKLAEGWIASNQTGRLLRVSSRRNQCICVFYIYDANFIKGISIKSHHRSDLLGAYESVYKWCESRGFKPTLHRMNNETSKDVEEFIEEQNADIQYTAPGRHCAPAERSVLTLKSCFKSTIASLPPGFLFAYWCRLLEQVNLSVNIVRPFWQNLKLSAWAEIEGEYHFDATPIAPPGSAMLMQVKPVDRTTYGLNAKKAWYLGLCLNHFQSFRGILPSTKDECISDTVKFQHHAIAMLQLTPAERMLEATRQLNDAKNQQPKRAPMD